MSEFYKIDLASRVQKKPSVFLNGQKVNNNWFIVSAKASVVLMYDDKNDLANILLNRFYFSHRIIIFKLFFKILHRIT
ncbi:hypothetical protein GCM10028827_29650 [Mucilaginibacter myungsuensis]